MDAGLVAWKLAFQLSPIILTGGAATNSSPLGMLPIIVITESINIVGDIIGGTQNVLNLDNFFANYEPLPGSSLISNQVGMYPFANQAVAANAIITQPLNISMLMKCPANNPLGYGTKLATMEALQATLSAHNTSGGTYSILTPAHIYTNCIMVGMRDVTGGESAQTQWAWQMDFVKPLVSLQDAQTALSDLMGKISSGGAVLSGALGSAASSPASSVRNVAQTLLPSGALNDIMAYLP